jgi:hypothetical protein
MVSPAGTPSKLLTKSMAAGVVMLAAVRHKGRISAQRCNNQTAHHSTSPEQRCVLSILGVLGAVACALVLLRTLLLDAIVALSLLGLVAFKMGSIKIHVGVDSTARRTHLLHL